MHACLRIFVCFSFCLFACLILQSKPPKVMIFPLLFIVISDMQRACLTQSECLMTSLWKDWKNEAEVATVWLWNTIYFRLWMSTGESQNENTLLNLSNILDYIFKGSQVHSASLGNASKTKNAARMITLQYNSDFSASHWNLKNISQISFSYAGGKTKQNKTVSIFKFGNANFWYSNSSL